uniref:Alpha-type protein kinase domain-containing protein n=1 Tax=Denticeps clupeoides TaxID=299321 RepID=A0AAY4A8B6_9TELE
MKGQEVADVLQECYNVVKAGRVDITGDSQGQFTRCREALPDKLNVLLKEAVEMKWPFVPEKWQYKHTVTPTDKVNLKDLISENLPQLLAFLRVSLLAGETLWAASVIFLVDRFLYWTDDSHRLLRIAKKLHQHYPDTPIAPQVIIRQARLYFSSGKLQKAEYILGSLINNNGSTGKALYNVDSDRTLVQAVGMQIRGQVLQKLGLWFEAAELICVSLIGFYALPQPDRKGIGASLNILANILVSMNDKDFHTFQTSQHIDMCFLGQIKHRLLSAAEAAKMAVVYSQYGSLFVLTNVVTQGTCLQSYSFSEQCPSSQKRDFLLLSKEAFEIGLLTKTEHDPVTSKQELLTFLKAAYCLTVTHKWLGASTGVVAAATRACNEAATIFYKYSNGVSGERDTLCKQIMCLVQNVKSVLNVQPFLSSDPGSFIPDSYRAIEDRSVSFTMESFSRSILRFQQHHKAVCKAFDVTCHKLQGREFESSSGPCITAFRTVTDTFKTECFSDSHVHQGFPVIPQKGQNREHLPTLGNENLPEINSHMNTLASDCKDEPKKTDRHKNPKSSGSLSSSLGSSWHEVSFSPPKSSQNIKREINRTENPEVLVDSQCPTDLSEDNICVGPTIPYPEKINPSAQIATYKPPSNICKEWELCTILDTEDEPHRLPGSDKILSVPSVKEAEGKRTELVLSSCSLGSGLDSSWQQICFREAKKSNDDMNNIPGELVDPSCPTDFGEDDTALRLEALRLGSSAASMARTGRTGNREIDGRTESSSERPKDEVDGSQHVKIICDQSLETIDDEPEMLHWIPEGPSSNSQVETRTSTSSISSSFGSQSSWQKVSPCDSRSPVVIADRGTLNTSVPPGHGAKYPNPVQGICESSSVLDPLPKRLESKESSKSSLGGYTSPERQPSCSKCFSQFMMGAGVLDDVLTGHDYERLLSGVCHDCLSCRLPRKKLEPISHNRTYGALLLKYSRATSLWTARETNVFIGECMQKGSQRKAFQVQFLHQEEILGSYVGKEYFKFIAEIQDHLNDVERQMTAQHYVTEFNKRLYDKDVTAQIFFIPSEVLLILEGDVIAGCVTVEPYMLGKFAKITNNTKEVVSKYKASEYGIAFGHFTYEFSNFKEVVVDLQGWITANGKGLTYLTDPQIHTLCKPYNRTSNFHQRGINLFLEEQHGPECNDICRLLGLEMLNMPKASVRLT